MRDRVKILIVDDLKENHLVMESVLNDPELDIMKAMSGEEALSLCLEHDFAVIFMDVQMPGMDGFETAELLRSIEKTKLIPIIFVTAISKEQKSIFKGYEVGAIDYLPKPIDPIILRSKARVFKELYQQRLIIEKQVVELEERLEELSKVQLEKDHLESLSMQDSLTTLYNRRGLDKYYQMHFGNCVRYQIPCAVIMIDIDDFKRYNDNYGHTRGDEILRQVAEILKASIFRAEDFVGRYGGEEFMLVMPNVDLRGAERVAQRMIDNVQRAKIMHRFSDVEAFITISLGVAAIIPTAGMASVELVKMADEQLYIAKNNGKNQFSSLGNYKDSALCYRE